jgi:hypothetical protein
MASKQKQPEPPVFVAGDKVFWKGIKLTVHKVYEDGSILAISPTQHVTVSSADQLEKCSGS